MNTAIKDKAQGKLTLAYVLEQLQQDKIISPQQKAQLYAGMTKDTEMNTHPLMIVADQGWQSITKPPYPLSLEQLTRWLAGKSDQSYLRIDPLKIEVNKVTGIVSQAYASKLHILPVDVNDQELTIATCEPFIDSWEAELAKISSKQIKRVIVNPRDIERYLIEFYGISR